MVTTSYSQSSCYKDCSKHWYLKYKEKWKVPEDGAALPFGSAFDLGIGALLTKKADYVKVFNDNWLGSTDRNGKVTGIFDNPKFVYGNNDFDEYVLAQADKDLITTWANEMRLTRSDTDSIALVKTIQKAKKFRTLNETEKKFLNRANWLSLKCKGEILMEAFKEQFLPKVKKVVSLQKHAYLKDDVTGDAVTGYLDFVLEIEGYDKAIIFDLKTAASPYKQEQIELSDQLTLYSAIESEHFKTDLVGYVICIKNIRKEEVGYCKKCNNKKTSRHQTCDVLVKTGTKQIKDKDGTLSDIDVTERCEGEWITKIELKPEVQLMVEQKTQKQMTDCLIDQGNIIEGMKQEIVFRNTSKCNNWFGSRCPYYNLCHNADPTGLIKKS